MKRSLLILLGFSSMVTFAQEKKVKNADEMVLEQTNQEALNKLQRDFHLQWEKDQSAVQKFSKKHGIPVVQELPNGGILQLRRIDANGHPVYIQTDNATAARTISTNKVIPTGISGLDLDGSGVRMGEWDGGGVRSTHREFAPASGTGSRTTQIDNVTTTNQHATHVAGTILAKGVDVNAKGMAINGRLRCFDFNNDNSEMTSEASQGMLLSNHSYGIPGGWSFNGGWFWYGNPTISAVEDYNFGLYDAEARDWDNIAFNAPYYLMVKSAGNNRNESWNGSHQVQVNGNWTTSTARRNSDGTYDNMTGSANSKNILVVGSVQDLANGWTSPSAVRISTFSSTGPTDDGRIKPDITANGDDLRSCNNTSDQAYTVIGGTSMSAPNATGSIALLQQLSRRKYGRWMRSATAKAVIIHSADEAGTSDGPDYTFGWGLMNTYEAARILADSANRNPIIEKALINKDTFSIRVYSNGLESLEATLAWTDVAGTASPAALNARTIKLVNDLDVRIIDSLGNATLPYVLDVNNRTAGATRGDNIRDNVEKVVLNIPTAGWYTIRVTHKGNLVQNFQRFSLVVTGAANPPIARVSASNRTVCVGTVVRFNDLSTTTAHSISWTFPGGTPATSTLSNPTVIYTTPGVYRVSMTISDSLNTYTFTDSNFITVVNSPRIDTLIKTPNNCNGNGSILAQVSGGYMPYRYSWGPGTFSDSMAIVGLRAGLYTLLVTDSNGCTATANATLADNGPVAVATATTPINCYGGNNGVATATVTGGSAPFAYSWQTNPPQSGAVLPNLAAGTYRVRVTDAQGCTSDTSITLTQPDSFTVIQFSNPNTGGGNGSAGVSVFGATPPYSYLWNTTPTQTSNAAFNLYGGPVQVTVTDAKGCVRNVTIQVSGAGLGAVDYTLPVFQMFPSPSEGLVMMYFENQSNENAQLNITSIDGKKVAGFEFGNQSILSRELNLSHLANGVYFATLSTKKAEKKVRFVIQH